MGRLINDLKEKTNDLIDEYFKRSEHEDIDIDTPTFFVVNHIEEYKRLQELKNSKDDTDYPSYLFHDMCFNHRYNYHVELLNMLKWYIAKKDVSDECKKRLVDMMFSENEMLVSARNELVDNHLNFTVTDESPDCLDNRERLTGLMAIDRTASTFRVHSNIICHKDELDFTLPLVYNSMIIAAYFKLCAQYGIPFEDLEFQDEIDEFAERLSDDERYKPAVEKLKTLMKDSIELLKEYEKGDKKEEMTVEEKVKEFFYNSMNKYGKEIALPSNQYFGIDQLIDDPNDLIGDLKYKIQYGYPQSGCVSIDAKYSQIYGDFTISGVSVFAPPAGQDFNLVSFTPEAKLMDELSMSMDYGLPNGSVEHGPNDIEGNPNAMKMLDFAIADLQLAEELGPCREEVEIGSDRIPVATSTRVYKPKGRGGI